MQKAALDIQGLWEKYSQEQQHVVQFERYQTMLKDDFEQFRQAHKADEDAALCAIYLADFVITSSQLLDLGITDDERKAAILRVVQAGMKQGITGDKIINVHQLSQELGMALRRSYVFLLDRGIEKDVAVMQLADVFLVPFFRYAHRALPRASLAWLSAVAEGATAEILHDTLYKTSSQLGHMQGFDEKCVVDASIGILERFSRRRKETPNTEIIVPLRKESAGAVLIRRISGKEEYMGYSEPMEANHLAKFQKELSEVCALSKFKSRDLVPIYYRGVSATQTREMLPRNFFLVRGEMEHSDYEAWFFLSTTADDINLELIRTRLAARCQGIIGIARRPLPPKKKKKPKKVKKEAARTATTGARAAGTPSGEKPSIWRRVLRVFGIGKKEEAEEEVPDEIPTFARLDAQMVVDEEPTPVEEEIAEPAKVSIPGEWNRAEVLQSWAESLVVDAVSGLSLEESYDTLRDLDYIITGVGEFPQKTEPTGDLFGLEYQVGDLAEAMSDLGTHMAELRDVAAQLAQSDTRIKGAFFVPEEVFLQRITEANTFELISFDTTATRMVFLAARTTDTAAAGLMAPNKGSIKRRSIQMRLRQLAQARTSNPLKERMGSVLDTQIKTSALQHAKLNVPLVLPVIK